MKKILIIFLALILAGCGVAAPAEPTEPPAGALPEPSQTPVVMVITATSAPTDVATLEPLPTYTALPTYTVPAPPTDAPAQQPAPTEAVAAAPTQAPAEGGPIKLDDNLGKGVFNSMTVTDDQLTLRCTPREITFTITSMNPDIRDALFYYRTVDFKRLYPGEWTNAGPMDKLGNGVYQIVFSGEDVNPNLRLDEGFLDFQFVGLNKGGAAIDRTQKFESLIKYYIDCPEQ